MRGQFALVSFVVSVLLFGCAHLSITSDARTEAYDTSPAFSRFNPNYVVEYRELREKLESLKKKMFEAQRAGRDVGCSRQILEETSALINNRAEFSLARERLSDLERSLSPNGKQHFAREQDPQDGSWGRCYKQWSWKVVETTERVRKLDGKGELPQYVPRVFDKINDPEKLRMYIDSLLVSFPDKDGISRRRELNETVTTLVKIIRKGIPGNYSWHPKLWDAFVDYMDQKWQNPETGFWGAWFQEGSRLIKTDDLSITFHIVSYRKGNVPLWEKIATTTLNIKDRPYPFGWRNHDGSMSNHHHYDVVRLLRLGWEYLPEPQKLRAAHEIEAMLDWSLKSSLKKDGSFVYSRSDDSLGDSYYFGVAFLNEVGYFNKAKRFWTTKDYPDPSSIRKRILSSARAISHPDSMLEEAIAILEGRDG